MITTFGLLPNEYAVDVQSEVVLFYNKSTQKSLNQAQNSAKPIASLAKKQYLCSHIAATYLM